jgi:hypothetical protein
MLPQPNLQHLARGALIVATLFAVDVGFFEANYPMMR